MIRFAVFIALATLVHGWETECGRSKYSDAGKLDAGIRIIGGDEARPNEFPWQVEMGQRVGNIYINYCGGIILNRNWILTAAHCSPSSPAGLYVRVGQHRRDSNDGTEVTYDVSLIINHPNFNWMTMENDIALLRTSDEIALNENVAAACQPNAEESYINRRAVVSGWGATQVGSDYSAMLMYVQVSVITNEDCEKAFDSFDYDIPQSMLCAGDEGFDERDACEGDLGGPLVVKDGNQFTVIGIVSWGQGCASGLPYVYTRVTTFLDWIDLNINSI